VARRGKKAKDEPEARPVDVEVAVELDQAQIDEIEDGGGLATFERSGGLFHVTPPDVANSLRFLLSKLDVDGESAHQTIAITSALEGEGVTSVARSLAAIMAHDLARSVCLLETNWWPPTGDGPRPDRRVGLADVLNGSCSLESAVLHTNDPNLTVLPSGRLSVPERPTVVASPAFVDALQLLTKLFETVIIDVPPILKASEGITIARLADATALVVRQGVTTEAQVRAAIDELGNIELLGVIVNGWSTRLPAFFQKFALSG
jgi:Mrp family chromosome partitioning ATPase